MNDRYGGGRDSEPRVVTGVGSILRRRHLSLGVIPAVPECCAFNTATGLPAKQTKFGIFARARAHHRKQLPSRGRLATEIAELIRSFAYAGG